MHVNKGYNNTDSGGMSLMQKIYSDSCKCIKVILSELQINKYMLVCGKSFDFSGAKEIIDAVDIPYVRFDDFKPNPLYEDVIKGVESFIENKCEAIVAVGGGSSIDVAKCIKLFSGMNKKECFLHQIYEDSKIPLIAVPTTAGTGSESTCYAVIYYQGNKQSVTHESIVPDYAILDSSLIKTLPLYHKKCALLDALCQGIESWWSVNSTEESKQYSKEAVSMIVKNMDDYLNGSDDCAANEIMLASNYAGRAINITQTTAAHAMSYKLTSMYGLAHGHAVAICLPVVMSQMVSKMAQCIDKRGQAYLKNVFDEISTAFNCSCTDEMISVFSKMIESLEIEYPLSKSKEDDIEILASSVNTTRLSNNPVQFEKADLVEMYERIIKSET